MMGGYVLIVTLGIGFGALVAVGQTVAVLYHHAIKDRPGHYVPGCVRCQDNARHPRTLLQQVTR
jgi:hypothetical protein